MSNVDQINRLIEVSTKAYEALRERGTPRFGQNAERVARRLHTALMPFRASLPEPSAKLPEVTDSPLLAFARGVALLPNRGADDETDAVETLARLIDEARDLTGITEDDLPECLTTGHHLADGRGMCRFGCGNTVTP